MRSVLAWAVAPFLCLTAPALAQNTLPAPEHALIVAARNIRQATTQSPLDMTLKSGDRITVSPKDVHEPATMVIRTMLNQQAYRPVDAALAFVLHVRELTPDGQSHVKVTLFSGATVRVRSDDIRDARLTFLRTALREAVAAEQALALQRGPAQAQAAQPSRDPAGPPPLEAAISIIRAKCAKDWPDDFTMRAYCQKQQDEGLAELHRRSMNSPDHRTIRTKCAKDWQEDFLMRNYCEDQQLKALASIR